MLIAIDFDGTIVEHEYPRVGHPVAGAIEWMRKFQEAGAKLILWTMRSGPTLEDAVKYCRANGVEFYGVNSNPTQREWTESPKAYAHVYVDDAAACCPLKQPPGAGRRPFVDWAIVGPAVMKLLQR